MLWLQSSIRTVAQELWYSPCTTIRSSWVTLIRDVDSPRSCCRSTALSSVAAASRFSVSPNSYGFRRARRLDARRLFARVVPPVAALAERAEQIAQRAVAEEVERLVGDLERHRRLLVVTHAAAAPCRRSRSASRSGGVVMYPSSPIFSMICWISSSSLVRISS